MGIFLRKNNVVFIGIFEIRVKEINVKKCLKKFVKGWKYCNNYSEILNGRIWLL